ncbi:MAG: hypothetical protein DMG82_25625 [Acidobacteria bacterium]|nr:MAG: hypothetical protein DMG82_25625 [Acidobacteriota bacterium]
MGVGVRGVPSATVGKSEEENFDSAIVGASGGEEPGAKVGASEGGGSPEGDVPGALEGERTAAPASAFAGDLRSPWNRPGSAMDAYAGKGKLEFLAQGESGQLTLAQRPREK